MKILITGGTGSLGSKLVDYFLDSNNRQLSECLSTDKLDELIVFSRDEQKQYKMRLHYAAQPGSARVRYVLGDVRDRDSVYKTFDLYHPDVVIHTAAQKHVRICDENPEQAVLTNVYGTQNVLDASIATAVKKLCFVSTDKAVNPTTLYGMTKAIAERLVTNAHNRSTTTKICGVRYGNVLNSVGSLVPLYRDIAKTTTPVYPVTNVEMTRFFITFPQALTAILSSLGLVYRFKRPDTQLTCHTMDGVFFVPTLRSARILDIAELFAENTHGSLSSIPEYPNEKLHELLTLDYCSNDQKWLMSKQEVCALLRQENLL